MDALDGINWVRIVGILAAGALAGLVMRALLREFQRVQIEGEADLDAERRVLTLTGALRHALSLVIGFIVVLLLLSELGVDIVPLLGAAGVVGVAVGLAAQGIARDFIRGLSLLSDNQIRIGDDVTIAGQSGVVEDVALRYVRLREYDGTVHFVPTGRIDTVTNRSYGTVYAAVDVAVDAAEDLERARTALRAGGDAVTQDPAFAGQIAGPLEIAGLDRWEDDAAVIRARLPVVPNARAAVRRELLARVKTAFDAAGIASPMRRLQLTRESPTAE
jgi:small conductance mechanosensitive channel